MKAPSLELPRKITINIYPCLLHDAADFPEEAKSQRAQTIHGDAGVRHEHPEGTCRFGTASSLGLGLRR